MSTKNEGKPKKRSKKREGLSEVMKKTRKGMLKLKVEEFLLRPELPSKVAFT